MVLVSINPFDIKKMFLLVAALLGLSSALCLADPLFMSTRFASRDHSSPRFFRTVSSPADRCENPSFATAKNTITDSEINWFACPLRGAEVSPAWQVSLGSFDFL